MRLFAVPSPTHRRLHLEAVVMTTVLLFLPACPSSGQVTVWQDVPVWTPSIELTAEERGILMQDGPISPALGSIVSSYDSGDCEGTVTAVEALVAEANRDLSYALHGANPTERTQRWGWNDLGPAARIRAALEVYVHTPVLALGDHGYGHAGWLSGFYTDCLVQTGQFSVAVGHYEAQWRLRATVAHDAGGFRWRMAILYAFAGDRERALALLETWPQELTQPPGFEQVHEIVREGQVLPDHIQVYTHPVD